MSGIQRTLKITPALSKVCGGVSEITRPQALKKIWEYINVNNLKSPDVKSQVNCDANLQVVFGQPTVTVREVMKLMSPHFEKIVKETE
jgi:chromatin remodeling complex protein RSC6